MTSGVPWQFRGVRREVLDTARDAARRSGVSVAEWLDTVIAESARKAGVDPTPPDHAGAGRPDSGDQSFHRAGGWSQSDDDRPDTDDPAHRAGVTDPSDIGARLERLSHQIDQLTFASTSQAQTRRQSAPDDVREMIADAMARLDDKIERLVGRSSMPRADATDRPVRGRGRWSERPAGGTLAPIDQALFEIEARQRALDDDSPRAESAASLRLPALERELRQLNTRMATMRPCSLDRAVETLRDDLAEIGMMLKDAMPREAIEALEAEVRALSERVDAQRSNGYDSGTLMSVERDIAEVRDALRTLSPAEKLAGLENAVQTLARKIDRLEGTGQDPVALKQLEGAIVALRGVVSQVASDDALTRLSEEVAALSAKVEQIAATDSFSAIERQITLIAEALQAEGTQRRSTQGFEAAVSNLSDKIDRLEARGVPAGDTHDLEAIVNSLHERIEWLAQGRAGSPAETRDLEAMVLSLSEKVERLALALDARSMPAADTRDLEATVHSLSDKIERLALDTRNISATDTRELEAMVNSLADNIEGLHATSANRATVSQLEERMAHLVEKLDASDARFAHLEMIERNLSDLLTRFDGERAGTPARALHEDADILKRDVRRTQDSLESVHGTLGHLVDRLADIETTIRNSQFSRGTAADPATAASRREMAGSPSRDADTDLVEAPPLAAELASLSRSPSAPLGSRTIVSEAGPVAAAARASQISERRPIDPDLPPDHPLEPGAARARAGGSAAERIAASEAALDTIRPPVIPDPGGKSNFIAAARRAAQAAMAEAPAPKEVQASAAPESITGKIGGRLRKLMVGTGVALFVLGSLHFVATKVWFPRPAHEAPTAQDAHDTLSDRGGDADPAASPGRQAAASPPTFLPSPLATVAGIGPIIPNADQDTTGSVRQTPAAGTAPSLPSLAAPESPDDTDRLPAAFSADLRAAALRGDATAEFEIAMRFAEARGIPQDLAQAAVWFERAAAQGLAPAQFRLGGLYEKGLGVPKNLATARRHYLAAAEAGNAKAMHNLAVLFAEGGDGKPDYPSAAHWFRKAADHGLADSQYNLGILYARGIGVETNLVESLKWFTLASREGDQEAGRKRDDVASRLDKASQEAAAAAVKAWQPRQQPAAAVTVPAFSAEATPAAAPKRTVDSKGDRPRR